MQLCPANRMTQRIWPTGGRPLCAVSIELTRRCSLQCRHCFCVLPHSHQYRKKELALADWDRILGECADEGALFLTITGGEPLLHPEFKEIWKIAKKRGFLVTLFSNGTLIDAGMADFLAEWTPYEVSISLYGASEETYQRVTGTEGMFQRVVDAFDRLAARGVKLEVKGVFSRINKADFESVRAIALRYCDRFRWDGALMGAFAGCVNTPQEIRLSAEELIELEKDDAELFQELKCGVQDWMPSVGFKDSAFRCGVGRGSAHIDAYGGMHPCLPLERLQYDLTTGSVADGWCNGIPALLENMPWKPGPCQTCDAASLCYSCTAFALLEGCSPTGPVPFRCALGSGRAKEFNLLDSIKNRPAGF